MASCTVSVDRRSITCNICGRTSWHPGDIENRYCGNCHISHDQTRELAPGVYDYHGEMHLNMHTLLVSGGYEDTPDNRAQLMKMVERMCEVRGIPVKEVPRGTDEREGRVGGLLRRADPLRPDEGRRR